MLANMIRMGIGKLKKLINRRPTVVVNQPYSTAGNGGRKLVRLDNGWLVAGLNDEGVAKFYLSKDLGETWSHILGTNGVGMDAQISIVSKGTMVYFVQIFKRTSIVGYGYFDALIPSYENLNINLDIILDVTSCSLQINSQGTELHACWSGKVEKYPNTSNIRYCKGTINLDGSVTWSSVQQMTTVNTTTQADIIDPSIIINNLGNPIIVWALRGGVGYIAGIRVIIKNSDGSDSHSIIFSEYNSNKQSNPSACIDKDGVIVVAWQGTDNSHPTVNHIRFSKSLNGGTTWEPMKKLASGVNPSITTDKNGIYYIEYQNSNYSWIIQSSDKGETWSSPVAIVISTNPSTLYDNKFELDFEIPLSIRQTSNSVIFNGKWYEE